MVKEFVEAWDVRKGELEEYIRTHNQSEYGYSYESLVRTLFNVVINPTLSDTGLFGGKKYVTDEITVIDDGNYQGCLLFILHRDRYQPGPREYIWTSVYYGSCSCCDTLQGIQDNYGEMPNSEETVKDYMDLLLHLLQNCHRFVEND